MFVLILTIPSKVSAAPATVLNGADVPEGQYPWMVGVAQAVIADGYTAQFCGGTLIAPTWVLTAAHCTFDLQNAPFTPADLDIIVGRNQLSSNTGERIRVDQIIRHPAFQLATLHADIALLHLSQPSTITPLVLSLAPAATAQSAATATLIGWGVTAAGSGADRLQEAQVPLVVQDACRRYYSSYGVTILATMLCAGDITGNIDACVGDSGGPLLVWQAESERWQQIGIVSWGAACGTPGAYGVYTNLSSFVDWVESNTGSLSAS